MIDEIDLQSKAHSGWLKYKGNPVLGGELGVCFDICVLEDNGKFYMYFSWRSQKSIALTESCDGIHWSEPIICIRPNEKSEWENDVNRPVVIKKDNNYHMWYTGQTLGASSIGYATSTDGIFWNRMSESPVLRADSVWEKAAVMCPHVIWNEKNHLYQMWYSGGEQYEPDAIGYAVSFDGIHFEKHLGNPIFMADESHLWEKHKVTACQVIKEANSYLMFYIGFQNEHFAQIGIARSKDGIVNWERYSQNPILTPGEGKWDAEACYKPFAIFDGTKWFLWYNGRRGNVEQIGLAIHEGKDLWH